MEIAGWRAVCVYCVSTWMIIRVGVRTGPDPPHGYSDSSDMVKIILQTVQNQDRVLKDLYTHLR